MNLNLSINNIPNLSEIERKHRQQSLDNFLVSGFPNKKLEDWKFTDFNQIISAQFSELSNKIEENKEIEKKISLANHFKHNYIILVNGKINKINLDFEEKDKILIKNYQNEYKEKFEIKNSLNVLNEALFTNGYYLEVAENYKVKKPLIIYSYIASNSKNNIFNTRNFVKLNKNSNLELIEFTNINVEDSFVKNENEVTDLEQNSVLKKYVLQSKQNKAYIYKNLKNFLQKDANCQNFLLNISSIFSKIEIESFLSGQNSNFEIYSASNLKQDQHQELRSFIHHEALNCRSYQKVKKVLNNESKGIYQGKILVSDSAQKTDAYQLSKAIILDPQAEFDAKPELEIYADDVKCSHGSSSGNIDENSIHYLMTRGISEKEAKKIIISGFLNEVFEPITNVEIKNFLEMNLNDQN
ncbi:MAG: Fe-S cluster assembly protein SufD [Pelagibacteraceae bacterium]